MCMGCRQKQRTSTAQHSTAQHSTAQHSTAPHGTAQHSTAQHSTAQHSTAQHSTAQHQHSTARHGAARHGTARHSTAADAVRAPATTSSLWEPAPKKPPRMRLGGSQRQLQWLPTGSCSHACEVVGGRDAQTAAAVCARTRRQHATWPAHGHNTRRPHSRAHTQSPSLLAACRQRPACPSHTGRAHSPPAGTPAGLC
jgi:hypothetical protein